MLGKRIYGYLIILLLVIIGCGSSDDGFIKDMESDNPSARRRAATRLMTKIKNPETVSKIIALLDSENERTVLMATQVLGTSADTSAVHPLGRIVDHPNPHIRDRAIESLGLIGHSSALPYIVKALDDSVSGVRHTAVRMLGYIDYAPAAKYLFRMFRDEADSVRAYAVQSLYMYHNDKEAGVLAADFAVPFTDRNERVRYITVQALGHPYPDSTVAGELLISALRDHNKSVRIEAITSLGIISYTKAVPYLKKMYDMATVEEEYAISETIKKIANETFPPSAGE